MRSAPLMAGSRLVYERVPARRVPLQPRSGGRMLLLADTIDIADGPFRDYLRDELVRRADFTCVDTIEQFRDEHRAVTRQGQVRAGDRHEKDDRSRVDDPRSWVLGWINERKITALTAHLVELQGHFDQADAEHSRLRDQRDQVAARLSALDGLAVFRAWTELDWADAVGRAIAAEEKRYSILNSKQASELETPYGIEQQ